MKYFVANNIKSGGGARLLFDILCSEGSKNIHFYLNLDLKKKIKKNNNHSFIGQTIIQKLLFEIFIFFKFEKKDKVLFFGNIPPLFPNLAYKTLFLQNYYMINQTSFYKISLKIIILRLLFRYCVRNIDQIIVQTSFMKKELLKYFKQKTFNKIPKITIFPFYNLDYLKKNKKFKKKKYEFISVTSSQTHKDNNLILETWKMLAQKNEYPSILIISSDRQNYNFIQNLKNINSNLKTNIILKENIPYNKLINYYSESKCLLFTSKFESFGLPIIESFFLGLKIYVPNYKYLNNLLKPSNKFIPNSEDLSKFLLKKNKVDQKPILKYKVNNIDNFLDFVF